MKSLKVEIERNHKNFENSFVRVKNPYNLLNSPKKESNPLNLELAYYQLTDALPTELSCLFHL
jgi:hypothetical protein